MKYVFKSRPQFKSSCSSPPPKAPLSLPNNLLSKSNREETVQNEEQIPSQDITKLTHTGVPILQDQKEPVEAPQALDTHAVALSSKPLPANSTADFKIRKTNTPDPMIPDQSSQVNKKSRMSYKGYPFNLPKLEVYQMLVLLFKSILSLNFSTEVGHKLQTWVKQELKKLLLIQSLVEDLKEKQVWYIRLRYLLSLSPTLVKPELLEWLKDDSICPPVIKDRLQKYWEVLFTYEGFLGLKRDTSDIERINGRIQKKAHRDTRQCGPILDIFGETLTSAYAFELDNFSPLSFDTIKEFICPEFRIRYQEFRKKENELTELRAKQLSINRQMTSSDGKMKILTGIINKLENINL